MAALDRGGEGFLTRTAEAELRDEIEQLQDALREIADHPTVERNPDGDDQAAATMQLIAREALHATMSIDSRGHASGYSVTFWPPHWHWTAYCGANRTHGAADTANEATDVARQEVLRLEREAAKLAETMVGITDPSVRLGGRVGLDRA